MNSDSDDSSTYDYNDYEEEIYGELAASSCDHTVPDKKEEDPEYVHYECLDLPAVENLVNQKVAEVSDSLSLSPSLSKHLLLLNEWNVDAIKRDFSDEFLIKNGLKCAPKTLGVKRDGAGKRAKKMDENVCGVCFDNDVEFRALECGHPFCVACWSSYVKSQVDDGKSRILCMQSKCGMFLHEEFIRSVLSKESFARFEQALYRDIITTNPELSFCPGADCSMIAHSKSKKAHRVVCTKCNTQFCFKCTQDYHSPTTCETIKKWLIKCADDSETANYISANTKDCPKCHASIEKNGGCNHMHCTKCGEHFCWICCQEWKSHGSSYYNCSKYNDASENNKADARKALERYLHYFTRYENHQKSLKLERQLFERIKERINKKVNNHEGTWIDWQYLYDAAELLTRSRYTLQYTYPFAYYLDNETQRKDLFEWQQSQLEKEIEELSWKVERAETTDRGDLEAQMHRAETQRRILLKDFFTV
ncbi:RBR-type E3 ubiquitin transferase [Aphelenchoides besseyi]|nr:RBR-type E3 ubiquitin transferase [Aphelenchoides besseyi]KAI6208902.1 RBR-type E3 ubiquitin transferase [Aphelenchoides besseyi]